MSRFRIESTRDPLVESSYAVSAVVCGPDGRVVAQSGDPNRVVVMRSSAKPFQALPMIMDGAAERFGVTEEELALACASHNSERRQVDIVVRWLDRIGCREEDLACGPHRPLFKDMAIRNPDDPVDPSPFLPDSPLSSNCSGKHTGMLSLAKHHDWTVEGYNRNGHPVQERCAVELARFAGVVPGDVGKAVDGCRAVTFGLPARAMARAFANLVTSDEEAPKAVVRAMTSHPELVGGKGRMCTAVMSAYSGSVLAKVGAEGVYGAALVDKGLGIALKVEDGNNWAAAAALVSILEQLGLNPLPSALLPQFAERPVLNTRNEPVGTMRAVGELEFV